MDLLDRIEDHRRGALHGPAYQLLRAVAVGDLRVAGGYLVVFLGLGLFCES
jgi:hypothetical protein